MYIYILKKKTIFYVFAFEGFNSKSTDLDGRVAWKLAYEDVLPYEDVEHVALNPLKVFLLFFLLIKILTKNAFLFAYVKKK